MAPLAVSPSRSRGELTPIAGMLTLRGGDAARGTTRAGSSFVTAVGTAAMGADNATGWGGCSWSARATAMQAVPARPTRTATTLRRRPVGNLLVIAAVVAAAGASALTQTAVAAAAASFALSAALLYGAVTAFRPRTTR